MVQKTLYPEGEAVCQNVLVHPSGGIAGGDELSLVADVVAGAHVQLTIPGATKWYRSAGVPAMQRIELRLAPDAIVEWLPQEAVVFNGAIAELETRVELSPGAVYIGWDVTCLGRRASGEAFDRGSLRLRSEIRSGDKLLWMERALLEGGAPFLDSPIGLRGYPAFGTFIATGAAVDDDVMAICRGIHVSDGEAALTRLPGLLVARYRCASTAVIRAYFIALWTRLRPLMIGRAAVTPRIWST